MAATTVCAWRDSSSAMRTQPYANLFLVRKWQFNNSQPGVSGKSLHLCCRSADEEPFLIFANRYYLRKLNLDGSNYTLLKQVRPRCSLDESCKISSRVSSCPKTNVAPVQGLNNAVALDFDYRQQMIYWTDVNTQGSMIRRMHINGSNVQVSVVKASEDD